MNFRGFSFTFLALASFALSIVVSSTSNYAMAAKSANPAENMYDEAVKFQKAYRFDEAIAALEQLKTKHPYSNFAKMARLLIADIHFEAKNFIQAQYTYQAYLELYPTDERRDYVLFKVGESLYKQLPKGHDRDLSSAKEAIHIFSNMLIEFPNSIYKKEATKYKAEVENKLIQKELYIAKFYFKYKHPLAALKRFKSFIKNNPSSKAIPEALAGAAYSAKRIDEEEVYAKYISELKSKYPSYEIPNLYTKRFVWTSL
jgi:outer membrane protein assembly factor BamD